MPRKTPSTANAVPLPQEGGFGDIMHKNAILRHGGLRLKILWLVKSLKKFKKALDKMGEV